MAAAKPKPFAQGTTVDPFKTLAEINALLEKSGADEIGTYRSLMREGVAFVRAGIAYRISVHIVKDEAEAKTYSKGGRVAGHASYVVAERARRLRSLLNVVRAKLIAVQDDIYTFEEMFGFDVITETGETIAERTVPMIRQAALEGRIPSSLPVPGARS